jgi:transaldolase/glucose-6-phosphate isomerase
MAIQKEITSVLKENPVKKVADLGQSIWIDYIDRDLVQSGRLRKMVEEEGVRGLTSNPAIFEKAMGQATSYDEQMKSLLVGEQGRDLEVKDLFESLAIEDIRGAADIFWKLYRSTFGQDGFVSFEVAPSLALETERSVVEARRLWKLIRRENVMIKIPGTAPGLPAIQTLISEGMNINVTLLFSRKRYLEVAEAYLKGLELAAELDGSLDRISSVASFFVSRIDSAIDKKLEDIAKTLPSGIEKERVLSLLGKVGIANAKLAYQSYLEIYSSERWKKLEARGARPQRLLWASTSTKDPEFRDVMYVEGLVGRDTVDTVPVATYEAFLDHGFDESPARETLVESVSEAESILDRIEKLGISLDKVTDQLTVEAIQKFSEPFEHLMTTLEKKKQVLSGQVINTATYRLPLAIAKDVNDQMESWRAEFKIRKLWDQDSSIWSDSDESKWLGWLTTSEIEMQGREELESLAQVVQQEKFSAVILLGMGGSSLAPELFSTLFKSAPGFPVLKVLDSTQPLEVETISSGLNLANTLFIVSSKSGGTLETTLLLEYFYGKVQETTSKPAGKSFIAITDPGSALEKIARQRGFLRVYHGLESIGGRYSALSKFGMVPLATMGFPIAKVLNGAEAMAHACSPNLPLEQNPGVQLGFALGVMALKGIDKVTFLTTAELEPFAGWLEQLLAESTGKDGKGLIPIAHEKVGSPEVYDQDRQFYYLKLKGTSLQSGISELDSKVQALEEAGFAVTRIELKDRESIGQEFFRWEMATAVAGSILKLNPFDQPDVEAAKIITKKKMKQFEETGSIPVEEPFFEENGIQLFTNEANQSRILAVLQSQGKRADSELPTRTSSASLADYLSAHLASLTPRDYFTLLNYVDSSHVKESDLTALRLAVRDQKKVATFLSTGPRYLHSVGQLFKGGPDTGVFILLTGDEMEPLFIPGYRYSFKTALNAEAIGDFEVLLERRRRALRIHFTREAEVSDGDNAETKIWGKVHL